MCAHALYCYLLSQNYLNVFTGQYNESATMQVGVRCTNGEERTLTENALKVMINTVSMVFDDVGYSTTTTLTAVTLRSGQLRTYTNRGGCHAEDKLIAENPNLNYVEKVLWINNTPCPRCALNLIRAYQGIKTKPIIAAAHFYKGGYREDFILRCLARMVKNGFKLMPFKWRFYQKRFISNDVCIDDINKALENDEFKDNMKNMENRIEQVYAYANLNDIECPDYGYY